MSNTSDQTIKQNNKTRLIVGEVGIDTETGIVGKGHSYDNGKTFVVDDTIYGRIYHADDHGKIWKGIQDQVAKVVAPAKSAADSAVSAADAAVASAQVTSDTVSAIASATAEAKQGANEAMSRALSAWDVATGAKEAVTDFDPLIKSAQSDASMALTQIADTTNALSDAKTQFGSDVAEAKELANTAQATADNAVKSASSVANDLTAVANQAKSNASGITKVTSDVGLLQTTVADNSGNISKIQETAVQIQQAVSDNAGNITVAKQTADSAVAVASDASSNATVAIQTASQASITAQNASGQAANAVFTASGAMTTASNAESDATIAVQTASGASLTATNAQSDATIAKQTASEATVQASNAESDFAQLSIRADKIETNVATNSGAIASVQQTANGLTTTVADIKANGGGVNLVGNSEAEFSGKAYDIHYYNLASLTALTPGTTHTISFSAKVDDKAVNCQQSLFVDIYNSSWSWWAMASVPISTDYQRFTYTFTVPKNITDANRISAFLNHPVINGKPDSSSDTSDAAGTGYIKELMLEEGTVAHTWSPAPDDLQAQFTQIKTSIDGVTTTINDPKTGLNATYQTAAGNTTTISNVKSDVTQLQTTANGLTSRVGSLESKTNTQQTTIDQNKAAIALKADQTDVNTLKGTVNQNTATLQTQAGQIQSKVSASDVTGMLTGYATQTYTQSLVTQTANNWNLNLTKLQTDVNAIKTTGGGVNLLTGTSGDLQTKQLTNAYNSGPQATNGNYKIKLVKGQTYTYRAWIDNTNGPVNAFVAVRFTPIGGTNFALGNGTPIVQGATGYSTLSVTPSADGYALFTPFAYGSQQTFSAKWKEEMLEEGTVAHTWSPAPSDMATVTSVTNLSATVDGIKSTVATKADQSTVTQLSNALQSKVESATYTSAINQLSNDINLRVKSADLISQINLQAGTALIQSNQLVLDANTTVFTGEAFIPSAAISSISVDKIKIGNTSLFSSDGTFNLINGSGSTASSSIKLTTGIMEGVSQPLTQLSNGTNTHALEVGEEGINVTPTIFFNDYPDEAKDTGWLGFSRHQTAELYFHTYDDTKELFRIACTARVNHDLHIDGTLWQQGLSITSGNTIWSGSDYLAIGDHISNTYTNVMARAFSSQSTLSSKTNIETVDPKDALDLVNRTDIRSYQYTADVAQGKTKRYTSLIIDDVNDVSQYYAPDEFTNEERTGRDDGSAVGYLFLAIQELTRRIKTLEDKLNG